MPRTCLYKSIFNSSLSFAFLSLGLSAALCAINMFAFSLFVLFSKGLMRY